MEPVRHDSSARRLLIEVDGHTGRLDYELDGTVMRITHTLVPRPIGGRGVAAELMRTALAIAAANGWTVKPVCSYAIAYMQRHASDPARAHLDELLDEALDESFPASDSPSVGGVS